MAGRATRPLVDVAIRSLQPDPRQPRREFEEEPLRELARSIARHGILQPLLITPVLQEADRDTGPAGPCYQIVAGERRWRAAILAGLTTVPALLLHIEATAGREVSLIENLHRSDLRPLELAQALETILRQEHLTQEELAQRLGKSRVSITNRVRLLHLGYAAQQALATGRISEGHARALLGTSGAIQDRVLAEVLARDLTVRQTEALVRRRANVQPRPAERREAADLRYLADALRGALCAKVALDGTERSGRIVIEYHTREELERLCQRLGGDELADGIG
jgi:ParB family transcriptional regulator, chromosome partitioning protein